METKFKITGNWNEVKSKLKNTYSKLTDEDLAFTPGKEDELLSHIEKKIGRTRAQVMDIIEDFQSSSATSKSQKY